MKEKILITGATGMLGATLVELYQKDFEVYATGTSKRGLEFFERYRQWNLKDTDFGPLIDWAKPDIIVHSAALTNGNYCEGNPVEAFEVNGVALKRLVASVKKNTKIIYISTDAVFPPNTHLAKEDFCRNPQSVYGKSKELGEFFLYNSNVDFTIVRTTIVGLNLKKEKSGFVEWIINSAKNNDKINLFDDVLFTPISIWHLAEAIIPLFTENSPFAQKAVHIAGGDICTKYEFGIALLQALDLPTTTIGRGKISEMTGRAKRNKDQSLDCNLFQQKSGMKLPDLKQTVENIKLNYPIYEKY